MLDTSSLTALVSALKAETQKDSITPERIGSILEKILDLIKSAATDAQLTPVNSWKTTVSALGEAVTALSKGTVNATSVHLSYTSRNINTGAATSHADGISIAAATQDQAGVMTATQAKDLAFAKGNIELLRKAIDTTKEAVTTLQTNINSKLSAEAKARQEQDTAIKQSITQHTNKEEEARNNQKSSLQQYVRSKVSEEKQARNTADEALAQKISKVESNVSELTQTEQGNTEAIGTIDDRIREEAKSRSELEKQINNLKERLTRLSLRISRTGHDNPIHIECHIVDNELKVTGAEEIMKKELIPIIFRYTVKQSRESKESAIRNEHDQRGYTHVMKGWHLFYDIAKVKFEGEKMLIRDDTKKEKGSYSPNPRYLFGKFFKAEKIKESGEKEVNIKVGYGKRTYKVSKGHIFKFALAFGIKTNYGQKPFDFRNLLTNLAIFNVQVVANALENDIESGLSINYCI